jgi:hypothetical protein
MVRVTRGLAMPSVTETLDLSFRSPGLPTRLATLLNSTLVFQTHRGAGAVAPACNPSYTRG